MQTEGQRNQDKRCTNNWSSLKKDVINIQKCIIPQSALWKLFEAEWGSYDFSFPQSLHSVLFYKLQLLVQRFCFSALLSVFCTAFSIPTMKLVFASHSGPGCNALWARQVISLLLPIYVYHCRRQSLQFIWLSSFMHNIEVKKKTIHNLCILLVLPRFIYQKYKVWDLDIVPNFVFLEIRHSSFACFAMCYLRRVLFLCPCLALYLSAEVILEHTKSIYFEKTYIHHL